VTGQGLKLAAVLQCKQVVLQHDHHTVEGLVWAAGAIAMQVRHYCAKIESTALRGSPYTVIKSVSAPLIWP
jgi:hypothetical protein